MSTGLCMLSCKNRDSVQLLQNAKGHPLCPHEIDSLPVNVLPQIPQILSVHFPSPQVVRTFPPASPFMSSPSTFSLWFLHVHTWNGRTNFRSWSGLLHPLLQQVFPVKSYPAEYFL